MASVRYLDRKLLRNIIRHTDTHNRLQEEDEMWRNKAFKAFGWRTDEHDEHDQRPRRGRAGMPQSRTRDQRQMERIRRMNPDSQSKNQDQRNWNGERNRNIFRAEIGNQERWGHTGFMELYPEEFINKDSMDEMSDDEDVERTKEKMKAKRKSNKKDKKSHKHRKTEEKPVSSSESDSSDSDTSGGQETRSSKREKPRAADKGKASREQPKHHSIPRRAPSFDRRADEGNPDHPKMRAGDGHGKRAPSGGRENSQRRQRGGGGDKTHDRKRRSQDGEKRHDRDADAKIRWEEKVGKREEELKRVSQERSRKEHKKIGSSGKTESLERRTDRADPSRANEREQRRTAKRSATENGNSSPARLGDQNNDRSDRKDQNTDENVPHRHHHHHHKSSRKEKKDMDSDSRKDKHNRRK